MRLWICLSMIGWTKMSNVFRIMDYLDFLIPNPKCELLYNKDYEFLIAVMLSAQTTDKRVNLVTKDLFCKYDSLDKLRKASLDDVMGFIRPLGNYMKKAKAILLISNILYDDYNGIVPNDREALEGLPMVGRKTANVVLGELFGVSAIGVDTHILRVSKRLGLVSSSNPLVVERVLDDVIPKDKWIRVHHQLVLFGRYYCKAKNPCCDCCKLKDICFK
jgi:endonuclease III